MVLPDNMNKNIKKYKKYVFDGHLETLRKLFYCFASHEFNKAGGNDVNINSSQKDWLNVAVAQRSNELLVLRTNIIGFVRYKNKRFAVFALPLSWLQRMGIHLSLLEKILTIIKFNWILFILSFKRIVSAFTKVLKATQNPKNFNSLETAFCDGFPLNGHSKFSNSKNDYSLENSLRKLFLSQDTLIYQSNIKSMNSKAVKYQPNILPALSYLDVVILFPIFICRLVLSLLSLFFGIWKDFYILDQIFMCIAFRKSYTHSRHKIYFFSFQGVQMRPIWTWEAEKHGAKIIQINYSSNLMPTLSGKIEDRTYLKFSTWPIIVPFSPLLKTYMEQTTRASCEIITKETLFYNDDITQRIPNFGKHIVNIVDVSPLDPNLFIGHNDSEDFLECNSNDPVEYFSRLLGDCIDVCSKLNCQAVLKPKRQDRRIHPKYHDLIRSYSASGKLHILSTEISPYRVVEKTTISIIQPFTSVGTITENRKKLFYYDPLNKLHSNHEAAFGTPIIKSKDQLLNVIKSKIALDFAHSFNRNFSRK